MGPGLDASILGPKLREKAREPQHFLIYGLILLGTEFLMSTVCILLPLSQRLSILPSLGNILLIFCGDQEGTVLGYMEWGRNLRC
jgi:hypothetical protein